MMSTHRSMAPALRAATALCLAGSAMSAALAQDAQTLQVRALAATCANCHGTQGRAVEAASVPGLAGLPASYMVEQMKAFKSGARQATVMHQLAKGYNDAQIEQIAAYYAAQKR
jgi:sulfide dehydrogenase cytochrome subunit